MLVRSLSLVALIAACFVASAIAEEEEKYPDKYDATDVDAILANDRLRNQYYNCFLEAAPCVTPDAIFLKEKFPEAIVTKCRKCTDKQKEAFSKVAEWFAVNDPPAWDTVIRKAVSDFQKRGSAKKTTPPAK